MSVQYFLGNNSPDGFSSYFDDMLRAADMRRVWILKGGPGCGKSTLMRTVAAQMEQAGHPVERVYCGSDPDSLDAIILPRQRAAVVDGTAPHVVEAQYPGVVEEYLNLGVFRGRAGLVAKRDEIALKMNENKACFERVTGCLQAARMLLDDIRYTVSDPPAREKIARRVRGIIAREIRPGEGLKRRNIYLSGITPQGVVVHWDTVKSLCGRVYEIHDNYGMAHELLSPLLTAAVEAKQEIYACYHPMGPAGRLEHLLLPGLDLAFVTSTDQLPYDGEVFRRIRLDACLNQAALRARRTWLRFLRKTVTALTEDATETLARALACHDEIEGLYRPHIDFDSVTEKAQSVADALLAGAH